MSLDYIDSQEKLERFVEESKSAKVLAIDTEFLREKTYYPNLCLIQVAADDKVAIIDPFEIDDLDIIKPLLVDKNIMKVFHAGGQDLEIIYNELGILPEPIFDVQVAAALLGQSYQAGLASILSAFLGINIKKSDSFTDWTHRPLSESQVNYAIEDVLYLPELYAKMKGMLEEKGRLHWLDYEFAKMSDPATYTVDPYKRYRHLKRGNQLSRKQMAAARAMAAWREKEAIRRNIPRKWVLSDEQIVEACRREASSVDDLFMVRGIKKSITLKEARKVAALMKDALASDESTWPKQEIHYQSEENVDSALDLMQAMLRVISHESGIAMQVLASNSEMTLLARGHDEESGLMSGWRREVVGERFKKLLEGKISMCIIDNELVINEL